MEHWLRAVVLLAVCALTLLAGCAGDAQDGPRSLHELERMSFVPAGRAKLELFPPPWSEVGCDQALLVDQYEITRADCTFYLGPRIMAGAWSPNVLREDGLAAQWPALLSQVEAQALCAERGMRLPSAREWLYLCVGANATPFPFGTSFQYSVANTLELGLGRPAPVGSFESGRSQSGCYDLLGNVWEWVSDSAPGIEALPDDSAAAGTGLVSCMGGSYLYSYRPTFSLARRGGAVRPEFHALLLDAHFFGSDTGARGVIEAETWLRARASEWGSEHQDRLREVGRRWGRSATPCLQRLCAETGAAESLRFLEEGTRS